MRTTALLQASASLLVVLAIASAGCDSSSGDSGTGTGGGTGGEAQGTGGEAQGTGGTGGGAECVCDLGQAPTEGACLDGSPTCFDIDCGDGVERHCGTEQPSGPPDCPEGEIEVPNESCSAEQGCHLESLGGLSTFCAPVGDCTEAPACETVGEMCDSGLDCGGSFECSEDHLWAELDADCG